LRFLAEDLGKDLDGVLDSILQVLAGRQRSASTSYSQLAGMQSIAKGNTFQASDRAKVWITMLWGRILGATSTSRRAACCGCTGQAK
jgi:hypothetical protein